MQAVDGKERRETYMELDRDQALEMLKALANETRLQMLAWLKDPGDNFPPQGEHLPPGTLGPGGVCVGDIQEKAGLSQSTTSNYLACLQRAGLVSSERHGRWTYYRLEEEAVTALARYLTTCL